MQPLIDMYKFPKVLVSDDYIDEVVVQSFKTKVCSSGSAMC
jgi:hypothetical protein